MPYYNYKAKDEEGKIVEGVVEAENEESANKILKEHNLVALSVSERKRAPLSVSIDIFQRVKPRDLVIFSRQLAVMVSAALPIVRALRVLVQQTANPKLKTVVSTLAEDVEGGAKLSVAFSKHSKVFNDFFIAMVRSGETTGKLAEVLNYLADQQEKDFDLISRIKGAMVYPAFILSGLIVVGIVMMIYVVPKMTTILKETGAELPFSTKLLISSSDFMVQYWWLLLIIVIALIVGFNFYTKTPSGKKNWDFIKLKIPIIGPLLKRIYLVRFTRSLGTLIVGKVPLPIGLGVVSDVVGNVFFKDVINRTIKEVKDGHSISTVFSQTKEIPVMVSQMLVVGEQTGQLEEILKRLTDFYTREIDSLVSNLVTLIEPLIMIVMGIAVGIMVAAIILPMYNLAGSF